MKQGLGRVVIGMDPHKRSVTIEVMTAEETVVGGGRFGTDIAGYRSMLEVVRRWPDRVWAIEGPGTNSGMSRSRTASHNSMLCRAFLGRD